MRGKNVSIWDVGPMKLLTFFMDNPYGEVYLREAAKKIHLSPFAVKKYADILLKESLIVEERRANLRNFKANMGSLFFRHLKVARNLDLITKSNLLGYLVKHTPNVSSIVLFGSMARGEDDGRSDLDLVVIGAKKQINLSEYEEKVGREINVHVFSWADWQKKAAEDAPFYNEVIASGIPLQGEIPQVRWK
ncbi:MAG: nucleotidyltransferase domain-containing protein [Candidatus Altiarchaeota archaeon]